MEESKDDMVAAVGASGGGVGEPSSRVASSFKKIGDRQVFSMELRAEETTIVSWKKLMKDTDKASDDNNTFSPSVAGGPSSIVSTSAVPAAATSSVLDSCIASFIPLTDGAATTLKPYSFEGQQGEREMKDLAPVDSFRSVIDKIEGFTWF